MAERSFRWVDEAWWKDWIFWVAAVVATGNLVLGLDDDDVAWWGHVFRWAYAFVFVLAVLGFVRVAVRTYQAPASGEE